MRPASEAELAEDIRSARGPLSILGGGTRLLPGEGRATPLRTGGLTGITLYEPAALTLVARAGTPLAEIEAAVAAENQMLAFEPPPAAGSTIGGVIAANASGSRRVQAGAARDALIGVRFVDGSGEVIANGGRVMKNVTGYDLVKLMAGSRGTLGVLTEVALKTAPLPPATRVLRLSGLSAAEAIAPLTIALTGPFDVTAALWLPGPGALIRLEGLSQSVAVRAEALKARLRGFQIEDTPHLRLDENILGGPGADSPRRDGDVWRILCRPSQAPAILATIPEPLRLDWGGALILARLPEGSMPPLPPGAIATRLTGAPARLPPPDPVTARLEAGLRARFDPRGLFASPA
ncbi:FAD-binding protein [Paracoccus sp. S-4012]|uniref:FAD-binding protein n=1 Tax=Paracoccus sp. S-4012 TaxID=2665648 RepID=UPI0012AFE8CE|nr:FAD-binding protein [Paracoccus sp. S-4012]MRX51729.1 FAD-binding protein [Paracoccus sp. S-4012]